MQKLFQPKMVSYSFDLKCYRIDYIREFQKKIMKRQKLRPIHPSDENPKLDVKLERIIKPIKVGADLVKTLNMPTIYFGLD